MKKQIHRQTKLSAEGAARVKRIRAEFASKPSKSELLLSGKYLGPMSIEEYLQWRKLNAEKTKQQWA